MVIEKDTGREKELEIAVRRLIGVVDIWQAVLRGEIGLPSNLVGASEEAINAAKVALGGIPKG